MNRLEVIGLSLEVPGRRLLADVDFTAEGGACVAVMGPSGAGKTSLLNCLCGIVQPTAGSVSVDGTEVTGLRSSERAEFRLRRIGIVFQFGELLPELNLIENIALPLRLARVPRRVAEERAADWLNRLGMAGREDDRPDVLSGGEIQRAAIARALVHEPPLVLADEPTGALDEQNSRHVAGLLAEMAKVVGATVIVATHDPLVAAMTDRTLRLRGGRLAPAAVAAADARELEV